MSDQPATYVHVGTHAEALANGSNLGPGEHISADDLELDAEAPQHDIRLIADGVLVNKDLIGAGNADNREAVLAAQRSMKAIEQKPAPAADTSPKGGDSK